MDARFETLKKVGLKTLQCLIECALEDLLEQLQQVKTEQGLTTHLPDLEDMSRCVKNTRMLPEAYNLD